MPASSSIVRRSGVGATAVLAVSALLVIACTGTPAGVERPAPASTPAVDLRPEAGALRTVVDGVAPDEANDHGEVLLVGDSVLVLVADDLARTVGATLHVDAADCRRIDRTITGPCGGVPAGAEVASGVDAVRGALERIEETPEAAVFVLANNSTVTAEHLSSVVDVAAAVPHLWFVNTRIDGFGRQDLNNRALAELADADPRVGVVDWFTASEDEPWLADDVHPNGDGQAALAALIDERLRCRCTA